MRLSGDRHLTYCSNVHPGESWQAIRDQVLPAVAAVKARVAATESMGVGLRLSAAAAHVLREPTAHAELVEQLRARDLYVFTLNGFPYGEFHQGKVKQAVYQPDWRDFRRLAYSNTLADVLASVLPSDVAYGSISTVPLGFRPDFASDDDYHRACQQLLLHVAHLVRLERGTGKRIVLALEPEPFCALETTDDCEHLFNRFLRSVPAMSELARLCDVSRADAELLFQRHMGLCLDTCHAAVEYEEPAQLLEQLRRCEIPIYKVQLSAGLQVTRLDHAARSTLQDFAEDVYLHQVVERTPSGLTRYLDLGEALATSGDEQREWRVHFHVPIFQHDYGQLSSTQPFLEELLRILPTDACAHLEVETYTWSVLPRALRSDDMTLDIASELHWAREHAR